MKNKFLRRLLAVSLCASLIGSAAVNIPLIVPESGITASAASITDDFTYKSDYNGGIVITKYTGTDENVVIPKEIEGKPVTEIGSSAFENNKNMKSVSIPDSVKTIGFDSFSGCTGLTSITIPGSVTTIDTFAFFGCKGLKSVTIPDSVTEIKEQAFASCEGLADSNGFSVVKGVLYDYFGKESSVTVPKAVTRIGSWAFESNRDIKSVVIPEGVKSIGRWAFASCTELRSVTIPKSVSLIEPYAFDAAYRLESINIPNKSAEIRGGAFYECDGLADSNGFIIVESVLYGYCGESTEITIPSGIKGISDAVFSNNETIKSVVIPNGVKSLGMNVFSNCKALTSVSIPDGMTEIGEYAFNKCPCIKKLTIPDSVESVGEYAFSKCTSLESVKISNKVTKIEYCLFLGCSSLKKVNIPDGVTVIDKGAFSDCTSLTDITIPDGVKYIWDNAFLGCGFTSVTIPDSVWMIDTRAFGYRRKDSSSFEKIPDFTIYGKTGSKAEIYANRNEIKFVSTSPAELTNESTVSTLTAEVNTPITLTAKAKGGVGPYDYVFYYKNSKDDTWTKITGYSTTDKTIFTPASEGKYIIQIKVRDSEKKVVLKDFTVNVTSPLVNKSSVSATSVTANTDVTMTGKAEGGTGNYKFAYYYKKSTDSKWTKAYVTASGLAYTKNTSVSFRPTSAGTYTVRINASDDKGIAVSKEFTVKVKAAALANNSAVSATSVSLGTKVTMTGKASGGTEPYKFAYYYKNSTDSAWTRAYTTPAGYAYTKNTEMTFKPTTAGTYSVRINVKDNNGTGTMVSKEFTVKVTAALKNGSTISATTVSKNTTVTLTGKATGGTSPYKYAYYYKKSTDSSWTKAYVTSSGSAYTKYDSVTFKPTAAGTYNVRINVKDKYGEGEVVSKDFNLTVK